ncbi:IS66 family transposase [Vibrio anguillarum]
MEKTPNINPESQDIAELQAMVKALMLSQEQKESQWQQERQSLLEQLKLAFDRQFAKRSEALKPYDESQGDLFNEAECEAVKEEEVEVTTTITTKKRGKRKPLPKTLPREVIELDLDDHEKQCSCCNHGLHKIGEDRSEKLEFTPAVLKVLEYVRPKYACRQCEKTGDSSHIVQKPSPQSLIPKSFATESLLANIILGKYQYAMPLYRQESLFTQSGIELSRTTMARWVIQVSEKFAPLYAALKKYLLQQVVVQADERCLAHARRKFMDAKKLQGKGKSGKADKALAKIQKLYGIESRLKGAPAEERKAERQALAKPILDELYQWMTTQKVIGSSPLGKAIKYTLGQWSKLTRYIDDGHLSIDNNRAERAIKPLVIGRKNWLFSNTPNGADASAMLYSIIETAKANGLILYDYLVKCMKELAKAEPDIDALLPWNFKH